MNWFLDMCIIIFYAEVGGKYYQKTATFVKNKKDNKFLICCYISKENMPKWILRQKIILKILKKRVDDLSFEIEKDPEYRELYHRDIAKLKKLITRTSIFKDSIKEYNSIRSNQEIMLNRIGFFITKLIDKEVVEKADFDLKSTLFTFLNNNSDAMTMASGIQHHQVEELILLTGDKRDWTKDNMDWVFDSRPDLKKKYPKIPEIEYIDRL